MLMFFGIINFMESIMVEKDALVLLNTIISKAPNRLTNGGLELTENEIYLIEQVLDMSLGTQHVQN
jgi:hypothetical protein